MFTLIVSPVSALLSKSSPTLKVVSLILSATVVFRVQELPAFETSNEGLLFFATSRRFSGMPEKYNSISMPQTPLTRLPWMIRTLKSMLGGIYGFANYTVLYEES